MAAFNPLTFLRFGSIHRNSYINAPATLTPHLALRDDPTTLFAGQITGVSQGRFPDGATNIVSFDGTASPGESNFRVLTNIVINEVLTHSETAVYYIEIFNPTTNVVDLSGWFLTDDPALPMKFTKTKTQHRL